MNTELSQQLAAVFLVMSLLATALLFLRRQGFVALGRTRGGPRQATRSMEMVERISLTSQHAAHLVRVYGRIVLITTAPSGCQLLQISEVPPTETGTLEIGRVEFSSGQSEAGK